MTDFITDYREKRKKEKEEAQSYLKPICKQLAKQGIKEIHVEYEGSGDSGCIADSGIIFINDDNKKIDISNSTQLASPIETFCYNILPSGWEINEGSFGTIIIDTKNCKWKLSHNVYEMTSNLEESEGEL